MGLERIVSGGQTGVDRAALDAAAASQVPRGGWCPRGRRAEDGAVPSEHPLEETDSRSYQVRTEWNVRDSDGTLILHDGPLSSGTALTQRLSRRLQRPCLCVDLAQGSDEQRLEQIKQWLEAADIRVLNIAGPRESSCPGIYDRSRQFLLRLLAELQS